MNDLIKKLRDQNDLTRQRLEDIHASIDQEESFIAQLETRGKRLDRAFRGTDETQAPPAPAETPPPPQPPAPVAEKPTNTFVTPTIAPVTTPAITAAVITVPARYTFTGLGTCWMNSEDGAGGSLYDGTPITTELGQNLVAVSLPCKPVKGRMVHVWLPSNPSHVLIATQRDVGPWSTKSTFVTTGIAPPAGQWKGVRVVKDKLATFGGWVPLDQARQPYGDEETCNAAIIDISSAGWSVLNGKTPLENWNGSPSGIVCFQIFDPADAALTATRPMPSPLVAAASDPTEKFVIALRELVGHPLSANDPVFSYDPLTLGGSLGCADAISTALLHAGLVDHIELSVDGLRALLHRLGWRVVPEPKKGRVCILGPTANSRGHGHVGAFVDDAHLVNNHSSAAHVFSDVFDPSAREVVEYLAAPGAS